MSDKRQKRKRPSNISVVEMDMNNVPLFCRSDSTRSYRIGASGIKEIKVVPKSPDSPIIHSVTDQTSIDPVDALLENLELREALREIRNKINALIGE